jgi:hypothetical protein
MFGAVALAGILALASLYRRRTYQALALATAAGATIAVVTSQGRGVVIASAIILIVFAALTITRRNRASSLIGVVLAVAVVAVAVDVVLGSAGTAGVRYQGLSPTSLLGTTNQARGKSFARIPHSLITYPFGAGLATAGPASGSAPGASSLTLNDAPDTETEFSFLVVETGIPGMVALVGFTIVVLAVGTRGCRREPDPEVRVLLAAVLAPLAGIFVLYFTGTMTPTVPSGPYLWAVGGIVSYWFIKLPEARRRALRPDDRALQPA